MFVYMEMVVSVFDKGQSKGAVSAAMYSVTHSRWDYITQITASK